MKEWEEGKIGVYMKDNQAVRLTSLGTNTAAMVYCSAKLM
jgi:hypothetical protein